MNSSPSIHSKRHSLNIYPTSGPRPLQLVNGITSPANPTSASTTSTSHIRTDNCSTSPSNTSFSSVSSPSSASFALAKSTPKTSQTPSSVNIRRHSSISYKSPSTDHYVATNPTENDVPSMQFRPKPRPKSLMLSTHLSDPSPPVTAFSAPATDSRDRKTLDAGLNACSTLMEERERPPVTLAEKHADLLRFIAQKESKCLELRSQLATHEAELVQLKRKWERIIRRSYEPPLSPWLGSTPSSPLLASNSTSSSTTSNIPTGSVFEGIKESVQGVSRLIASGLSISNDHHHHHHNSNLVSSPLALHSQTRSSSSTTSTHLGPRPKPRPHSLYSHFPSITSSSHIRSVNLSTSSTSSATTSTTGSGRTTFSAASSSSSSLFEEDEQQNATVHTKTTETTDTRSHPDSRDTKDVEDGERSANSSLVDDSWSSSELIVRDTGATPMMSPNPKFKTAAGRRRRADEKTGYRSSKTSEDLANEKIETKDGVTIESNTEIVCPGMIGNSSAICRSNSNSRCHRRKSRDISGLVPSSSSALEDCSTSPRLNSNSLDLGLTRSGSTHSPSLTTSPAPETMIRSQRNSVVGMFAPVSAIPGLDLAESTAMPITGAFGGANGEITGPLLRPNSMQVGIENETSRYAPSASQPQPVQQTLHQPSSSWMGKKLDKWNQKRASGLLSDVSQTLAYAFSLSATSSTNTARSTSSSILDQDDDLVSSTMMDEPMKPAVVVSPRLASNDMCYQGQGRKLGMQNDDESEWNW